MPKSITLITAAALYLIVLPLIADELPEPDPDPDVPQVAIEEITAPVAEVPDPAASDPAISPPEISTDDVESVIQPEIPQINPGEAQVDSALPVAADTVQVAENPDATTYLTSHDYFAPAEQEPLEILGEVVQPGQKRELNWSAGQSFSGRSTDPPVLIIRGTKPGPVLCMVAAIHGDELNGIEIVRRVMTDLDPALVSGTVIGVPIVNIYGFTNGSRYLPDRRDLNRYFPGRTHGSSASRIAWLFFNQIVKHCNMLVDFHTGSFKRTNLPQLRADLNDPAVMEFIRHFGATAVLHKSGVSGNLRTAATRAGIPAVTFELGQPGYLQTEDVEFGVRAIETLLGKLGLLKRYYLWFKPQPIYYGSRWIRSNHGGILRTTTQIGASIQEGDLLGIIINPLTSEETEIRSPVQGRVLGMALNQFMLPGYAAFHIGIVAANPGLKAGAELLPLLDPETTSDITKPVEEPVNLPPDINFPDDADDDEESH